MLWSIRVVLVEVEVEDVDIEVLEVETEVEVEEVLVDIPALSIQTTGKSSV